MSGRSYTDRFRTDDDAPVNYPRTSTTSGGHTNARLLRYIEKACNPTFYEPNLALNLEVADMVNSKKGTNSPRDAAVAIVKLINNRNAHTAVLAVALLDICVKNCGYPFHLQISRKEFLNDLVKRFPERPPPTYSRIQALILEAIEEWTQTICRTSRFKDDLGYIRDMHRLLSNKGYIFPEINKDDAAVLNPSESLKSAAEIEAEEREAQSAKLQELIRRGKPADLREANKLMKIMTGAAKSTTDARAVVAEDLDKIRRKSDVFAEMLEAIKEGDDIGRNDTLSELYSSLKSASPKIEKILLEEKQDEEAVAKLLALNDRIHSLLQKYDLLKQKDFQSAKAVDTGKKSEESSAGTSKQVESMNLIDFDDDVTSSDVNTSTTKQDSANDLLGDLSSLSFGPSYGQGGSITLSRTASPFTPANAPSASGSNDLLSGLGSLGSNPTISTPPSAPTTNYDAFASLGNSFSSIQRSKSPQSPLSTSTPVASITPKPQAIANTADDEWGVFTNSAPNSISNPPKTITIHSSRLKIEFDVTRETDNTIQIEVLFSNTDFQHSIENLAFQVAVPKAFKLRLKPQSATTIQANTTRGIIQTLHVDNVVKDQGNNPKVRWRVSYNVGGSPITEDGTVTNLPTV